jgi:hypothetical protein
MSPDPTGLAPHSPPYRPRHAARRRQGARWLALTLAIATVTAAANWATDDRARSAVDALLKVARGDTCVATAGADSAELTSEQMSNAATIAAAGLARSLPRRAVTIAIATAMQESSLRNLGHGDRDSLGLFQQRPSAGWGTPEEIRDPVASAGAFYAALSRIPDYETLPLTVAAQAVQVSAFPQAYAKHEAQAAVLASVFTGGTRAALHCAVRGEAGPDDAASVRQALNTEFKVTAHVAGTTLDVGVPAMDGERSLGWAIAHWAVAKAAAHGIAAVSHDGRAWTADGQAGAWQPVKQPASSVRIVLG